MILTLMISLGIVATSLPVTVSAEDAPQGRWTDYAAASFAGGSGTKADPYQIATAEQLALLASEVNNGVSSTAHFGEYFILTADIDLSGHVWTPLGYETYDSGNGSAQSFCGYFDGNHKKITGLYVDERTGDQYGKNRNAGFFGCISATGNDPVIQNLTIENGTVLAGDGTPENDYGAGLLVGNITVLYGTDYTVIQNCTVSGTVNSASCAGGLAGNANYTHFKNCRADVKIGGHSCSGGFVGNTFESQFINCSATGDVTSTGWSTGGFAGVLFSNTTVNHCAALGKVEANDWNLGGFAGYAENNITITNSIAMGDVKSNVTEFQPKTGGFLGTDWNATAKLEKCHAAGKITTARTDTVGGLIGAGTGSSAVGCSFDNEKNGSLSGVGSNPTGTYEIDALDTAGVLSNICMDFYGGHSFSEGPEVQPTCTRDGHERGWTCVQCGYKIGFAVIKAPGHTGGVATCTARAICTVCKEEYGDTDPDNHTGEEIWVQTATTHEKKWNCCGAVTVANKAHKWVNGVCSECNYTCQHTDADRNHFCDFCNKTLSGHMGGTATCKNKAICTFCRKAYGELDPGNHADLKHVVAKEATKDAEGNIEYWYCEGCGKYYSDASATKEIAQADTVIKKLPETNTTTSELPAPDTATTKQTVESNAPKTGDSMNLMLWFALLFVCSGTVFGTTIVRKKKEQRR